MHMPRQSSSGGKLVSKSDFKETHFYFSVDENSSEFLTINSFKALYKMKRISFGLNS